MNSIGPIKVIDRGRVNEVCDRQMGVTTIEGRGFVWMHKVQIYSLFECYMPVGDTVI